MGFLRQAEQCENCGLNLGRYNVGLLLPFAVITVVGHLVIFGMLDMELNERASPAIYLAGLIPASIIVSLAILRPAKGLILGILWSRGLSDDLDR